MSLNLLEALGIGSYFGIVRKSKLERLHSGLFLGHLFRNGRLSADECATGASADTLDHKGGAVDDIERFAQAAAKKTIKTNRGERSVTRNSSRNVMRTLRRYSILPAPFEFQV